MKPMDEKGLGNVIKVLKTPYLEKGNVHVSDHWELGVMNLIRDKSLYEVKSDFFKIFQQLVWKIAPVTGILALLLGIAVARIDFLSDYELVKIFINDPSDFSFLSLYNGS